MLEILIAGIHNLGKCLHPTAWVCSAHPNLGMVRDMMQCETMLLVMISHRNRVYLRERLIYEKNFR